MRTLAKTLALSVALGLGGVSSGPGDLLAAEPGLTSTNLVVIANNDFAFDLFYQLTQKNEGGNIFFSPYSLFGALTMTAEGARNETALEMGNTLRYPLVAKGEGGDALGVPWGMSPIHAGIAELNRKLKGPSAAETAAVRGRVSELRKQLDTTKLEIERLYEARKWREAGEAERKARELASNINELSTQIDPYEIRVANALWGEQAYPFDPEYLATINKYYETGGMFSVDFRNDFDGARLRINSWVEEQTNDRIKNLIPRGALDTYTRLVLANAIYFKGEWSVPFRESDTEGREFALADGTKTSTPIMHAARLDVGRYGAFTADGKYFDTPRRIQPNQDTKTLYPGADGFAALELPYKGSTLSMVVIAPNDPAGLSKIEKQLARERLDGWMGQLKQRETHVYLPKFKMEAAYTLSDGALQELGMKRAFVDPRDPNNGAQFDGMITSAAQMERLYISQVFHKSFVEVNEKGTEAAAATAVTFATTAAPVAPTIPFIPEFRADRPFIFLIRENTTGCILFLGRVLSP